MGKQNQENPNAWINKFVLLSNLAVAITAIIAIFLSLQANRNSAKAIQLSRDIFLSERRVFLKSERIDDGVLLKPLEKNQQVNSLTVLFPSKLNIQPIILTPPDLIIYDSNICLNTRIYLDSITPPHATKVQIRKQIPIKALILTHAYTKGVASITNGGYDFFFQYARSPEGESMIKFKGVALNNYHPNVKDPQRFIDETLMKIEKKIANK